MKRRLNPKLTPYLISKGLRRVPESVWHSQSSPMTHHPIEFWCSSEFMVQVFQEMAGGQRLSINRIEFDSTGERWRDGITWDQLQQIKREIGRGDRWAVEVYPRDQSIVNDANMRHLFLVPEAPAFAWKK